MSAGELTIVTPCLKNLQALKKTLQSCLCLSALKEKFEHIVVDGSPEVHRDVRLDPTFSHIRWIDLPPTGIYPALNEGTRLASGNLIWHLHAGDTLLDFFALIKAVDEFKRDKNLEILFSPVQLTSDDKKWTTTKISAEFRRNLLGINRIPHQGVLFKKDLFQKVGYFPEEFKIAADYALFVRAANANCRFFYFREAFASFDMTGTSQQQLLKGLRETKIIGQELILSSAERRIFEVRYYTRAFCFRLLNPLLKNQRFYRFLRTIFEFIPKN